jgi:hypothetical protein
MKFGIRTAVITPHMASSALLTSTAGITVLQTRILSHKIAKICDQFKDSASAPWFTRSQSSKPVGMFAHYERKNWMNCVTKYQG